jgi:hypothetical protein
LPPWPPGMRSRVELEGRARPPGGALPRLHDDRLLGENTLPQHLEVAGPRDVDDGSLARCPGVLGPGLGRARYRYTPGTGRSQGPATWTGAVRI